MSLSFKNNLEEMRDNSPATIEQALDTDYKASENYDTPGNVRNLCFVWPDGRMKFMNYAYLISGEYSPASSDIILIFTSNIITIKGLHLEKIFSEITTHLLKTVYCINERYTSISETNVAVESIIFLEK